MRSRSQHRNKLDTAQEEEEELDGEEEEEREVDEAEEGGQGQPALSCAYRLCQDALPFILPALTRAGSSRLLPLAPPAFEALLRQKTVSMKDGEEEKQGPLDSFKTSLAGVDVGALAVVSDASKQPNAGEERQMQTRQHIAQHIGFAGSAEGERQQKPCVVVWRGRTRVETFVRERKRAALLSECERTGTGTAADA
jgi:hypothetical protein